MHAGTSLNRWIRKGLKGTALTVLMLFASPTVEAAPPLVPRATLLISLDTTEEQRKPLLGPLYQNYSAKIERKFRQVLARSGLQLIVIDRADLHDLNRELQNPANVALFWLSHASDPKKLLKAPLGAMEPVILDAHGSDVKTLFANRHPNLRWLSVVACSSALILDENAELLTPENQPEIERRESIELPDIVPGIPPLLVQRFAVKKGAVLALAEAARGARRFFRNLPEVRDGFRLDACTDPAAPRATLRITRAFASDAARDLDHPALAILWGKQVIGTLPRLRRGEGEDLGTYEMPLDAVLPLLRTVADGDGAPPLQASTFFEGARKYSPDFAIGELRLSLRIPQGAEVAHGFELPLVRVEKRPGIPLGTVSHAFEFKLSEQVRAALAEALSGLEPRGASGPCPEVGAFD